MRISEVRRLGTLSLVNFARKHAEKCGADPRPEVQARATTVGAAVRALEDSHAAYRPLRALWEQATTIKDDADDGVESVIREISYDLLAPKLLNKERSDPRYRVLFPQGNLDFINGADRVQVAHVRGMVKVLRDTPSHPMADRAARLEAVNEAFDASLAPQTAAESAFRASETLMRDQREALYRTLRKSVTYLRDQLDGDEAAVEKLFPTVAEARVNDSDDTPGE